MHRFIFLIITLLSVCHTLAANADPRMENFDTFIKQESEIINRHPFLLFGAEGIPLIRQKAQDAYFQQYCEDLLRFADVTLKRNSPKTHFPFAENPNYQTLSEVLVMAFLLTGDKTYARRAIDLTTTFVDDHYLNVPVHDSGKFARHLKNGNSVSYILNTVAIVYDTLYAEMTEAERFMIRRGLAYFCKITYEMAITEEYGLGFHKNYCAGQMGALGLACLAIEDETNLEVHEWLDKAKRVSLAWCNVAIKPDGVYPEGVTYLYYMLRNQTLFFEALKRREGINYFQRTNLKDAIDWTLWSSLPWRYEFDNFSDGAYTVNMHDIPFILQNNFPEMGDFLIDKAHGNHLRYRSNPWALLFGTRPRADGGFVPETALGKGRCFPKGGMAAFRTGWNEDDLLLLTYATDYEYAAHSQADRGHFNIYGYGKKWAVDSGYGNDAKFEHSATPSQAHNIVLIDGKGQAFDPSMRQSGTFSKIVDFRHDERGGYVKIDQQDAYNWYARYHFRNKLPYNPVKKAFRHLFLVEGEEAPPYILVYDDIQKDDRSRHYDWQFHTAPSTRVETNSTGVTLYPLTYSGPTIYANGSGGWDDSVASGFNIFREKAGSITFKVEAPKSGNYALWALGRGTPYTIGEAEVLVGSQSFGRFKIGQTRDFSWIKFSLNTDRMHRTEWIPLTKGENLITLRGVSSGYEAAEFMMSTNPDFTPQETFQNDDNQIRFGSEQITHLTNAVVRKVVSASDAQCRVTMLHPPQCDILVDSYQPTRDPAHPRMLFQAQAVNPHFLALVFPHKADMNAPVITSRITETTIEADIEWPNCTDQVIIRRDEISNATSNTNPSDGDIRINRLDKQSQIIRALHP